VVAFILEVVIFSQIMVSFTSKVIAIFLDLNSSSICFIGNLRFFKTLILVLVASKMVANYFKHRLQLQIFT
jgi:hypothetical protein